MLTKGASLKSETSLGIWRNKLGDTSDSTQKGVHLLSYKIDQLNLSSLKNDKTIEIAVNNLVVPVYQFATLENKCCLKFMTNWTMSFSTKFMKLLDLLGAMPNNLSLFQNQTLGWASDRYLEKC